jgi:quercetin dioxygenase-like cupin family protein
MIKGSRIRKRAVLVVGTALLILAAAAAVNVVPSAAVDPPPPILAEPLTARSVFPDQVDMKIKLKGAHGGTNVINIDNPGRTAVVKFTLQPGARFPWHTHPGVVFVNIVSGSFRLIDSDTCGETPYAPGQAFVDAGHGHVHTAYNPSSTETTVLIATFFEVPETGPLSIPADPAC